MSFDGLKTRPTNKNSRKFAGVFIMLEVQLWRKIGISISEGSYQRCERNAQNTGDDESNYDKWYQNCSYRCPPGDLVYAFDGCDLEEKNIETRQRKNSANTKPDKRNCGE